MYIQKNNDGSINLTAPVLIPDAHDCDYHNGETPLTTQSQSDISIQKQL